jgi:hypothetical protein
LYFVTAILGQMLGGACMAVGIIVGLRLALPSLARRLVREMAAAREDDAEAASSEPVGPRAPVVTLGQRDELRNG